jgi:transcriptional regulator with XRE-family HTH domain
LSIVKNRPELSIVKRNKRQFALGIIDPRIIEINRDRARLKMSHGKLSRRAGLHVSTWRSLRKGQQAPKARTITKLRNALATGILTADHEASTALALHRLIVANLAHAVGENIEAMIDADFSTERPMNPTWHKAAQLRRWSIYVLTVELEVSNVVIARALGCTRQNIKQARDAVEDKREADAKLDAALRELGAIIKPLKRAAA